MPELSLKIPVACYEIEPELFAVAALGDVRVWRIAQTANQALRRTQRYLEKLWADPTLTPSSQLARLPSQVESRRISVELWPFGRSTSLHGNAFTSASGTGEKVGTNANDLRQRDWLSPVVLTVTAFFWQEHRERLHAEVPALALHAMSHDAESLEMLLRQQLLLMLSLKARPTRLRELTELSAVAEPQLEFLDVSLRISSLRQQAQTRAGEAKESELKNCAEQWLDPSAPSWSCEQAVRALAEAIRGTPNSSTLTSVLIVAPAGAGKTTWVKALAKRLSNAQMNDPSVLNDLRGHEIWHSSGARLIAGQSGFGQWQERCQNLVRELRQRGSALKQGILHLGDLRELMEVGRTRAGEQSIAGFLRQEIAYRQVCVLVECTPEALHAIEKEEPGLVAAFHVLRLSAPDPASCSEIARLDLQNRLSPNAAANSQAALTQALGLHERFAGYSARPAAVLSFLRTLCLDKGPFEPLELAEVNQRFSRQSGLPLMLIDDAIAFDSSAVSTELKRSVLGQEQAVQAVVERLLQIKAELQRRGRPLASFLLVGPTGTGKTELAKAVAKLVFGSEQRLTRFDLSQYTDAMSIQRLVGSSAFGAEEGLLTSKVREQPFCVLLLDEFEKAHPSFFDLLLQVLGDARLSDGSGRVADFSNAVILLTSNIGAREIAKSKPGFAAATPPGVSTENARLVYLATLHKMLRAELVNRFDAIVPFNRLDHEQIAAITERELQRIFAREGCQMAGLSLSIEPETLDRLSAIGFDPHFGARALKRSLEKNVVLALMQHLHEYRKARAKQTSLKAHLWLSMQKDQLTWRCALNAADTSGAPRLQSWQQLTQRAQTSRRQIDAWQRCARVLSLRDEHAVLLQRNKRLLKRQQSLPPHEEQRLQLLTQSLDALLQHCNDLAEHEGQCLLNFWQMLDGVTALESRASELRASELLQQTQQLQRRLFKLGMQAPDRVLFILASEFSEWNFDLLQAYRKTASQQRIELTLHAVVERNIIEKLDPSARNNIASGLSVLPWKPVIEFKQPEKFWQSAQTTVAAYLLEARGDLARPLFAFEQGLHSYKPSKSGSLERFALVSVLKLKNSNADPLQATPPRELLDPQTIANANRLKRRAFWGEKKEYLDPWIQSAKMPLTADVGIQDELAQLVQQALRLQIERFAETLDEQWRQVAD